MGLLEGKVALVTGGGNGLGRCHALALAREGAKVVVNDLGGNVIGEGSGAAADGVVAEIRAAGGEAFANHASVADWAGAASIVEDAASQFGGLDIVVNNAGINRPATILEMSERDFDLVIAVHLKGTAAVSHHAARFWHDRGRVAGRAIINTTSPVGLHPQAHGSAYGAAKAGIIALTQANAQSLAALGVRVNAIAPAARTRMVEASPDVARLMPRTDGFDRHAPEHVAQLVVYLASPLCRFTGRVFGVEGPDVAIYQQWSAEELVTNDQGWMAETLAKALAQVPEQSSIQAFFPGGRVSMGFPPGRTLRGLGRS